MSKKNYIKIKDSLQKFSHPEVFFAFSKKQFDDQVLQLPPGSKIMSWRSLGCYGTQKGLDAYRDAILENSKTIKAECTPQEVYDHEFWNHECGFTGDDTEALTAVLNYFGAAGVRSLKIKLPVFPLD